MLKGYQEYKKVVETMNFNDFMDNDILLEKFDTYIIYKNLSGQQSLRIDNYIILNCNLSAKKQREVILHELAHKLLHINYCDLKKFEAQANKYGALMAMPDKFIYSDLADDTYFDTYELSDKYNVPHNLLIERINQIYYEEFERKNFKLIRTTKFAFL